MKPTIFGLLIIALPVFNLAYGFEQDGSPRSFLTGEDKAAEELFLAEELETLKSRLESSTFIATFHKIYNEFVDLYSEVSKQYKRLCYINSSLRSECKERISQLGKRVKAAMNAKPPVPALSTTEIISPVKIPEIHPPVERADQEKGVWDLTPLKEFETALAFLRVLANG